MATNYRKEVNVLEKLHKIFARMVSGVRNFSYEDSLKSLGLSTLESKSLGGELIDMLEIIRGLDRVAEKVTLRLVNGGSRCAGRVEIHYKKKWGTVNAYSWDLQDATVVCRELGCGPAVSAPGGAHFGEGTGPVVFQAAQCTGTESALRECASYAWGHHSWWHSYDAGVICSESAKPRLMNGSSPCAGRLEIYSSGSWATVCGDGKSWSLLEAEAVCKSLGCGAGVAAPLNAHFGEGSDRVIGPPSCGHQRDVGVICSDHTDLRLSSGATRCSGRLETQHGTQWGTICDVYFVLEDAGVVCDHLRCGAVAEILGGAHFGKGTGPVWRENYRCRGNESSFWDCPVSSWDQIQCSHENDVSVICSEHMQIRLSDGGSPCAGRVEVYYDGIWGSVCDDSWDVANAHVACKQLGCGNALEMTLPDSCRPGSGPVWLDEINCSGNESFLWDCPSAPWSKHVCSHKEDVRIMCSEHKELRLVNGMHRCEGRVEVFYNGTWGTVCSESLDSHDAEVICKQLQCGHLASIDYYARLFGEGSGPILLDEVECMSHESTIWQCQTDPWGKHNCHHREDAGVVCSGGNLAKERAHSANH
ncbi:scavenger receptor cysteine-rich domain-containing protein DMBT1-like [Cetorhinus maximus]